jgi:hypothetical protein
MRRIVEHQCSRVLPSHASFDPPIASGHLATERLPLLAGLRLTRTLLHLLEHLIEIEADGLLVLRIVPQSQ